MKKQLGNYFIDISKLVFGGSVLSAILEIKDVSNLLVLILGTIATIVFATLGFLILKNYEK